MTELSDRLAAALAGRYSIERELGRGGMAVVYLARDERHQRLVALKVMLPEVVGEQGAERFIREIRLAARLTHPNIVTVFDSGEADDLFFYAMPFIEGESLSSAIARSQQLSITEAVGIARQVADALDYAHAEGVIHRDIKPANILLTRSTPRRSASGGIRTPVVTDFGIARAMSGDAAARLTATGLMVGTPTYMSPEQWGGENIDGRSDQYSLACVLYEMLIGEPPFSGPNPMVVFARHTSEMVPSLRIVRSTVPDALEQAIFRALSKMAADRFDTMADFSDAIGEAIERPIVYGTGDQRVPDNNVSLQRTRPPAMETTGRAELRPANTASVSGPAPTAVAKYESPRTTLATVPPPGKLRANRRAIIAGAVGLALVGASIASWRSLRPTPHLRLMVFPFENAGPVGDSTFADGLTGEIISRLSGVPRLSVVARTSTMTYKGTTKTAKQLAKELNVDRVVRGTVKWKVAASDSRQATVSVSIENAADETEKSVVEDLDAANLNNLYDIASKVAAKLDVTTGMEDKERQRLVAKPTQNREAYQAYVEGNRFYNHSWGEADVRNAIDSYQKATFLDPNFALAFAALGRANGWIFQVGIDRNPARFVLANQYIDSALKLSPDLPEAHLARGLILYWKDRDYDGALREFRQVQRALPSSAETFNYIGNIYRRKGALKEAVESYATASDLDPRAQQWVFNRAETLLYLREFEASELLANKVIELAPDFIDGHLLKATLQIHRSGNVAGARKILTDLETRISGANWRAIGHHWRAGLFRIVDDSLPVAERRAVVNTFGLDIAQYLLARGEIYHRFGQNAKATAYYDSATKYMELTVQRHPEWGSAYGQLGVAAAGLQKKDLAVQSAEKAAMMVSPTSDALDGPEWVMNVAVVYTMIGDKTKALEWLEKALRMPSRLSAKWIALDPVWAPLRDDPRFKRLVDQPPPLVAAASAPK